jgi:all-trans-nonaprenyl-diphosphate synthase
MIHTASLVHDDVLDDCSVRRGKQTINNLYGTRVAVLAGDFLFAQSSWLIANLENMEVGRVRAHALGVCAAAAAPGQAAPCAWLTHPCRCTTHLRVTQQVIKLISRVIADFANGEISQASSLFDTGVTLQQYLEKSFYKTASLVAASCRSSAVFSDMDEEQKAAMYAYGNHLGLAFQVRVRVRVCACVCARVCAGVCRARAQLRWRACACRQAVRQAGSQAGRG